MNQTIKYLPGFDGYHIESYFSNDTKLIEEVFMLSDSTIQEDIDAVQHAFEASDIYSMREAIHKINPVFNIVGLLTFEQEIRKFYNLSLQATSFEELRNEYAELLPKLRNARVLINEQTNLFHRNTEKPVEGHNLILPDCAHASIP